MWARFIAWTDWLFGLAPKPDFDPEGTAPVPEDLKCPGEDTWRYWNGKPRKDNSHARWLPHPNLS